MLNLDPLHQSNISVIKYSIEEINEIESKIDTILDNDIIEKLLEIKKNNKFLKKTNPVKLKYSTIIQTAQKWKESKNDSNREEEHFIESINLNLNKLTNKLYDTISTKIVNTIKEYGLDKARNIILDLIFNKSISEKQFADIYCKLCLQLIELYDNNFKISILEKSDSFYITNVQNIFIKQADTSYDDFCDNNKLKKKLIGIFIFMGYLYIHDIISKEIIIKYIESLFSSIYNSKEYEVEIYCICELIPIIGKKLEKDLLKDDFEDSFDVVILNKLNKIKDDKQKYKAKHRFLILNVIDLKKNNWMEPKRR